MAEVAAGLRPGTPDNLPLIGPTVVPGLHLATGHHRGGVLLAPLTADLCAEEPGEGDETGPGLSAICSPLRFREGGPGEHRSREDRSREQGPRGHDFREPPPREDRLREHTPQEYP